MSDHYATLGVSKDASPEEIKKAYRKKARQLHPDVNPSADAAEEFKRVTLAYEVLSDTEKRRIYDATGDEQGRAGGFGGAGFGGFGGAGFGFQDLFDMFTGGQQSGPASRVRQGQDSLINVSISLRDAVFGVEKTIDLKTAVTCQSCQGEGTAPDTHPETCDTCHGAMCQPGTSPEQCTTCHGSGFVTQIQNSLFGRMQTQAPCPTCQGFGSTIAQPCTECSGAGRIPTRRTLSINIPAGASEGTQIRVSGEAEVGQGGGPNGDLYLLIREKKHPVFDRRGDDLHTWITIPMTTAALGTEFELDTLDGKKTVTINAGTQPNDDIVLEGLGVGHLQRSGRGAMHVHVDVEIPKKLDETSRSLLEQLAQARGEVRVEPHRQQPTFFDKLRDTFMG